MIATPSRISDRSSIKLGTGIGPRTAGLWVLVPCLAAGWAVAGSHATDAAALVLGVDLLVACYVVEWLSFALLGIALASFADPDYWPEIHGVKVGELLLALVFAVWALRRWPLPRNRASRIASAGLGIFVVAEALGAVVAHERGVALADIMHGLRPALYYAAFWPLLAFAARPSGRRQMFAIAAVVTLVVTGLMILQVTRAIGSHHLFLAAQGTNTLTRTSSGLLRIRPSGLELIYVTGMFAIAYLLWGPTRKKPVAIALAGTSLLAVALSLNRNMLVGLAAGLALAILVVSRGYRVLVVAAVIASIGVLLFAAFGPSLERSGGGVSGVATRFASIGDYQELKQTTLQERFYENQNAISTLRKHSIFGIGWGASYGATYTRLQEGVVAQFDRGFIHQQYLWLWLRTGLAGLLSFLAVLAAALWSSVGSARRPDPAVAWEGAGAFVSLVALGAGAFVAMYFADPNSIVAVVGVLALAVAPPPRTEASH